MHRNFDMHEVRGDRAAADFFDRSFNGTARKIFPGDYHVTGDEAMIATVLGSCVSVCLYDRDKRLGGMNHFMLPGNGEGTSSPSPKYGAVAMNQLFDDLISLGANPDALEAKVVGAGRVIQGMQDIGRRNADFAIAYLQRRKVKVVAVEIGDVFPRKVLFVPATGQLFVKRLRDQRGFGPRDAR